MARAFKFPRWWPDIQLCPYFFAIFVHAFHTSFYRFSKGDISKLTARLEVRPHNPIVKITNPLFMHWNPIATLKPDNPNVKNTIPPFMFWNPFAKTLKGGGADQEAAEGQETQCWRGRRRWWLSSLFTGSRYSEYCIQSLKNYEITLFLYERYIICQTWRKNASLNCVKLNHMSLSFRFSKSSFGG